MRKERDIRRIAGDRTQLLDDTGRALADRIGELAPSVMAMNPPAQRIASRQIRLCSGPHSVMPSGVPSSFDTVSRVSKPSFV